MSPFFLNSAAVLFLFIILTQQGASQVTLTPPSSTPCPGDEVTLVCHHPEVATNAQTNRYLTLIPAWRENGSPITPAPGSRYQATTAADLMSTTLTFTISAEQFNESFYYYYCFLVLAGGGLETSENATVKVSELSSPFLTSTSSPKSSITVEWLAVNCARSYNIYWQCTEPGSNGSTSTTSTSIIVPVNESAECTLSVVAINAEGSAGSNTAAAVYPGFPRPANASSSTLSCTNRSLLLTCQFGGGEYTDIQWTSSRGPVDSSRGSLLTIDDASTLQQGTEFWCSGLPVGGTRPFRVRGKSYVYSESLTCEPLTTPLTSGGDSAAAAAAVIAGGSIGGVLVVVIVFIAGCVSGVLAHVVYQKMATKKSTAPPPSPPASSYGHTQGDVGAGPEMTDNPSYQLVERIQDKKQLYQNL